MICPKCKTQLPAGAVSCPKCGTRFRTKPCPYCRAQILSSAVKCPRCGKALPQQSAQLPAQKPAGAQKKPITKRWWFWTVCVLLVLGIVGNIGNAMKGNKSKEPDLPSRSATSSMADAASAQESDIAGESRSPDEARDVLQWQIEAGCKNKFDGYTAEIGETAVIVTVWRESIDNTYALMIESGSGADNEDWEWLKTHTKDTSDYIADCIRTSELSNLTLQFHVVDSGTHKQEFFSIEDTEIVYDALARSPDSESVPQGSSQETAGTSNNFNTYSEPDQQNTSADYILNTSSMKFHYPTCNDVSKIAPQNYAEFHGTREEVVAQSYSPCGHCKP